MTISILNIQFSAGSATVRSPSYSTYTMILDSRLTATRVGIAVEQNSKN